MPTFKYIKSTDFDTNGVKGSTHVVAYKGRAMTLSTLSFAESPEYKIAIDKSKGILTIEGGSISVVRHTYYDDVLQSNREGLRIMPKFDLEVDAF